MTKNKKRRKVFSSILIFLLIASIIAFYGYYLKERTLMKEKQTETPPLNSSNNTELETPSEIVKNIVFFAKQGEIAKGSSFVIGKTKQREVINVWGKPEKETEVNQLLYDDYPNKDTTIGYKNDIIADLRSKDSYVQKVRYDDILKSLGEPDNVSYYKDADHNQIILGYDVSSQFRLKWILKKPNEANENPSVDHISIVALFTSSIVEDPQDRIRELIANMSLDEKIGQLIISGIDGTTLLPTDKKLITEYHIGGLIFYSNNLLSKQQTLKFVDSLINTNKINKFPLFMSVDQEGGRISRLPEASRTPSSADIGIKNDRESAYSIGETLAEELKKLGFNLDFAPVLDVNSNPNNPVIGDRSFGSNANIVAGMGIQVMKGIQSKQIISVIKHFPGHGDTSVDSHLQLPIVNKTLNQLQQLELIPFQQAINNGADVVMVAHILLPNLDGRYPSSMSKEIISTILRKQMNYNGVIITDDMTMGAIINNYGIGEASVLSLQAGSDIILVAHDFNNVIKVINSIKSAVKDGTISEERINESVERVILLKEKYLR
ncbi:beta-N-acetylhexosaminidase [Bacillus sp. SORGH_AS 510]|uniref:beta-N-acetylhexosaminidase n=1 Tax=Bacillus sp. SORGH_AS_0510 TaxID=3041771 RepID=UPI00277E65DA|nr:beta-N-acetylhexosaminidase [Bacillus sp. SORGH_AS_0510]MDQ1145862.1 beta-N-acetylhexosaminidase [Bacillus sp. SORGH_AS_0510]